MTSSVSEFFEHRCSIPIHLHPSRLANVKEGVEEQLNALLMTYVDELGGVLISYSDLELNSDPRTNPLECGFIFQERSWIHFEVAVRAVTWNVKQGEQYTGVVNAVAPDHLSILMHGLFNATIPLSGNSVPKHWQYDTDRDRWIDSKLFKGDDANEQKDEDDSAIKAEQPDPTASGKKLTKKELKKLERKKLRSLMLAATGGGRAQQQKPADGIIVPGVHIRFECTSISHTDEMFKLSGSVLPKKNNTATSSAALGLSGGWTPLPPVKGISSGGMMKQEESPEQPADDEEIDMSLLAAVTAPTPSALSSSSSSSKSPALNSTHAPSSNQPPAKKHTDKQQERYLKKKAKLAERLAEKGIIKPEEDGEGNESKSETPVPQPSSKKQKTTTPSSTPSLAPTPAPSTDKKKRKNVEDEDGVKEKKKKKVKTDD